MYREWAARRNQFLLETGECAECGGAPHDVHEILGGSYRHLSFKERACWLALCRTDHEKLQSTSIPYQLALKLLSDPEGYDLNKFFGVWGKPLSDLLAMETLMFVHEILLKRGGRLAA